MGWGGGYTISMQKHEQMMLAGDDLFIKNYIFIRRYILWVGIFYKTSKWASEIK